MSRTRPTLEQALQQAVVDTFTEMAFLDAIPIEPRTESSEVQLFALEVRGDRTHRLVMDLPLDVKRTIVENVHAIPWDDLASDQIDDCLLEFLNILGGTFGRMYWGDDSRYKLSFPEVRTGLPDDPEWETPDSYWFDAYGQIFAIHVARAARVTA